MNVIRVFGILLGVLACLVMLVGFIPFFGALNWLNIPFAIIGLILSAITRSISGMILCSVAAILGMMRLIIGGGLL